MRRWESLDENAQAVAGERSMGYHFPVDDGVDVDESAEHQRHRNSEHSSHIGEHLWVRPAIDLAASPVAYGSTWRHRHCMKCTMEQYFGRSICTHTQERKKETNTSHRSERSVVWKEGAGLGFQAAYQSTSADWTMYTTAGVINIWAFMVAALLCSYGLPRTCSC